MVRLLSKDKIQKSRRSTMQAVHSKDTKPEIAIRKLLSTLGYRYRLHRNDLPGTPDIVFIKRKKVIFVHGCFWHGHTCTAGQNLPKTNRNYWIPKLQRNQERDKRNMKLLKSTGWDVIVIWECQIKRQSFLSIKIKQFLDS
jgi:DNA mismatch endonuclease (patch repair protein)